MGDPEPSKTIADSDGLFAAQADSIIKSYTFANTSINWHPEDEPNSLAKADALIKFHIFANPQIHPEDAPDTLTSAGEQLSSLASTLLKLLSQTSSRAWERDLQFNDLTEEVARLKDQLRDSVTLCDLANPPRRPMSALEVAYKKAAEARKDDLAKLDKKNQEIEAELEALRAELERLKAELESLREKLANERSKNWMLKYQWMDMGEEVWRLNVWLRNSVALCDLEHPPRKPKAAMERALEEKIAKLEARIRNPIGRGRSKSVTF
ncbi:hypothetical protein B0T26DRAFT_725649 [Lasiosphaeria miniovina]|uniref:Uncharacterized protein n=1 Tax=Lasiosphaeria miniovina TaxID=1954250 RepID=A0AA39ZYW2_9PEZI|nr:uncharacterized protein B0T26DRAFT_725649 [Lasiosphaeria miniovina]KAK0706165.1 hypothetical protein B0T26DRAFT_725649 [Lasiosphaeria miniovina]